MNYNSLFQSCVDQFVGEYNSDLNKIWPTLNVKKNSYFKWFGFRCGLELWTYTQVHMN